MEAVRKISIVFLFVFLSLFIGCASKEVAVEDPLVIAEITPLPKNVQVKKQVLYEWQRSAT